MPRVSRTQGMGFRMWSGFGTRGGAMTNKTRLLLPKAEPSARTEGGEPAIWVDWFWGTQAVTLPSHYRSVSVGDGMGTGEKIR